MVRKRPRAARALSWPEDWPAATGTTFRARPPCSRTVPPPSGTAPQSSPALPADRALLNAQAQPPSARRRSMRRRGRSPTGVVEKPATEGRPRGRPDERVSGMRGREPCPPTRAGPCPGRRETARYAGSRRAIVKKRSLRVHSVSRGSYVNGHLGTAHGVSQNALGNWKRPA